MVESVDKYQDLHNLTRARELEVNNLQCQVLTSTVLSVGILY